MLKSKSIVRLSQYLKQAQEEFYEWNVDVDFSELRHQLEQLDESVQKALTEDRRGPLRVVLLGDFSSGKSSLINSLLGQNIAPIDVNPTTKICTTFKYGDSLKIQELTTQKNYNLRRYQSLVQQQHQKQRPVLKFVVTCNCELLKDVELIDTMGLHDPENVEAEPTWEELRTADVACYLLKCSNGTLGEDQKEDLKRYMMQSRQSDSKIWIILTKIDAVERGMVGVAATMTAVENICKQEEILCDKILPYCVRTENIENDEHWKEYEDMQPRFCQELTQLAIEREKYHAQRLSNSQKRLRTRLNRWKESFSEWCHICKNNAGDHFNAQKKEIKTSFMRSMAQEEKELTDYLEREIPYLEPEKENTYWLWRWKNKYILQGDFDFWTGFAKGNAFGLTGKNSKQFRDFMTIKRNEANEKIHSRKYESEQGAQNGGKRLRKELIYSILSCWKFVRLKDNRIDLFQTNKLCKEWEEFLSKLTQLNQQVYEVEICLK